MLYKRGGWPLEYRTWKMAQWAGEGSLFHEVWVRRMRLRFLSIHLSGCHTDTRVLPYSLELPNGEHENYLQCRIICNRSLALLFTKRRAIDSRIHRFRRTLVFGSLAAIPRCSWNENQHWLPDTCENFPMNIISIRIARTIQCSIKIDQVKVHRLDGQRFSPPRLLFQGLLCRRG